MDISNIIQQITNDLPSPVYVGWIPATDCYVMAAPHSDQVFQEDDNFRMMICSPWRVVMEAYTAGEGVEVLEVDSDMLKDIAESQTPPAHGVVVIYPDSSWDMFFAW